MSLLTVGALALLHEAGDLQTVLSWGEAWLGQHPDSRQAQDAALALALAHCDTAGARMDKSTADVLSCTEEMQAADALLKQYNTGPVLRQDIHAALQVRLSLPAVHIAPLCAGHAGALQAGFDSCCSLSTCIILPRATVGTCASQLEKPACEHAGAGTTSRPQPTGTCIGPPHATH